MTNAINVPGDADGIDEAEGNEHPPGKARKGEEEEEDVGEVGHAREGGDDVPAGVGPEPGIGLDLACGSNFHENNLRYERILESGNDRDGRWGFARAGRP